MPPVSSVYGRHQAPSCFDRVKYGFMMGACVGLVSGGLFGGFRALSMGLRGRELLSSLTKVMIQGGGTFGTFMAIGTAIRC
ncbi:reactive oxygen species modulator 1-like protein [Sarcoptes scabiei]|uniref:Reactive oxygen species modulator 1 n=1 Tax=Sarcoptes scabiei TaxID=52283 RepID=A0A132AKC5_SARSC|nr:reactive oxygen species modulator 1-like protein [Sarcoptes scabiei]